MNGRKSVSLADVARQAGVSSQTVSRVVRNDPEVAAATRDRIQALLAELDYKPNLAARALASSRTGVIHVLIAAPMFHGHAQAMIGVLEAADAAGLHVTVSSGREALKAARGRVGSLAPLSSDGVIILGGEAPVVPLLKAVGERTPLVLALAGEQKHGSFSTVSVDDVHGARLAARHLMGRGVSELVNIIGPQTWVAAVQRRNGFAAACAEHGVHVREIAADSWNATSGYAAMQRHPDAPLGLFAANDQLALGAMRALHERGVSIPSDTAVVGFDDMAGAESFYPPLTTVHLDFAGVGRAAVSELTARIGGSEPRDTIIEPVLVVRESSRRADPEEQR